MSPLKIVRYVTRGAFISQAAAISRHLKAAQISAQLSAENRITKCNNRNNIFTGVPALLAVTAKEEMFFNMQMSYDFRSSL